jgi:hypothetical protein
VCCARANKKAASAQHTQAPQGAASAMDAAETRAAALAQDIADGRRDEADERGGRCRGGGSSAERKHDVRSFFVSPCSWLTVTAGARRGAPMHGRFTDGLPTGGRLYNAIIAGERVGKRLLTHGRLRSA